MENINWKRRIEQENQSIDSARESEKIRLIEEGRKATEYLSSLGAIELLEEIRDQVFEYGKIDLKIDSSSRDSWIYLKPRSEMTEEDRKKLGVYDRDVVRPETKELTKPLGIAIVTLKYSWPYYNPAGSNYVPEFGWEKWEASIQANKIKLLDIICAYREEGKFVIGVASKMDYDFYGKLHGDKPLESSFLTPEIIDPKPKLTELLTQKLHEAYSLKDGIEKDINTLEKIGLTEHPEFKTEVVEWLREYKSGRKDLPFAK